MTGASGTAKPSLRGLGFVAALIGIASLPLIDRSIRGSREDRCASDGLSIDTRRAVRVETDDGAAHRFCCVECAERWLAGAKAVPTAVTVTDEAEGTAIDSQTAWFVRSLIVADRASGARIHVFARREDADAHAAAFHGTVLLGNERPFRSVRKGKTP